MIGGLLQIQHQESPRGGEFFLLSEMVGISLKLLINIKDDHTILADHTWVDSTLRGQGVARQLLDILVAFAREKQLKIVPVCSYVETAFETDTQYADVVA